MKLKKETKRQLGLIPGYIILILFCLFIFIMVGWIILASFSTTAEIFRGEALKFKSGFHLENYVKAIVTNKIGLCFLNSILYTVISCIAIILIAAPTSYALCRYKFKGNTFLQLMFMTGLGIPTTMIIMPLFSLTSRLNLASSRTVLIILYIGLILPFTVFFMYAFFRGIPSDYVEAAKVDGCDPYRIFWRIMLPLAQPGLVTVTIFNIITVWNEYFVSLIFANDSALRPVAIGLVNMINSMKYTGDWAGMFAAVVVVFLPTFILYIFLSDRIVAGITAGGIKG